MRQQSANKLPIKANKILNAILVVMLLIVVKVWHLAVIQHEKKQEEAQRPQRRVVIERSERASIYDRFGISLAINKVQYNAAISYGPIRELPRWKWQKGEDGKRIKSFFRRDYITQLSQLLAEELHLDPVWIEDMVHSKAAILGNVPCTLKENISEKSYFRLKMLEKDWPGIYAEVGARRCYPVGDIGGEVIGNIGPISSSEYTTITREMSALREALAACEEGEDLTLEGYRSLEDVSARLEELENKAYRINDFVGKMGVEAFYDENLRGSCGKYSYLADTKGNFLRQLPGSRDPTPGTRLVLTLSAELQAYAQQLLAEYENEHFSLLPMGDKRRPLLPENRPWIKGGAIVAMDPHTGEIFALAGFPSFDPNDFIRPANDPEAKEKNMRVNQWLETEEYLAHIWNMKIPYTRRRYLRGYFEEQITLGWETYLSFILPEKSPIRLVLDHHAVLKDALGLQIKIDQLLALFAHSDFSLSAPQVFDWIYSAPEELSKSVITTLQEKEFLRFRSALVKEQIELIKEELIPYFSGLTLNNEKMLLVDLYRLIVDASLFTPHLSDLLGEMSLSEYREATARFSIVADTVCSLVKDIFLETDFKQWREEHFQDYLAQRRQEEKLALQKNARPYIEYLEKARQQLFQEFWEKNQWDFIALFLTGKKEVLDLSLLSYSTTLGNWVEEVERGAHKGLDWVYPYQRLRLVTDELDSGVLIPFLKTLRRYEQLNRPLIGRYSSLRGSKEKDLAAAFHPSYGYGFARSHAFRQAATIGSIFKLVPAYEALRQKYLDLKSRGESLCNLNPLTIIDDKHRVWGKNEVWNVGYTLEGKTIPMYYRGGRLPRTDHFGVGKVDLARALETSSNPYFSMLAGDVLEDPEDLCRAANLFGFGEKTGIELPCEYAGRLPIDIAYNRTGLYSTAIGQHTLVGTPLQTAVMLSLIVNGGKVLKPQIVQTEKPHVRWRVFMPPQIQELLLTGLRQVVMGEKGTARHIRKHFDPALTKQMIGKTSTSEVIERVSLDPTHGSMKLKHVWFGGISYESDDFSKPELVVVVYLRYGGWGKDAAPLAVEMVKKWRELKKRSL